MPSFIDVVTKNPALAESFKESTNKYLVPAILATLGTGAISYGIAGSKKRIGESDSARRRRIIRATLLPTLAAAVGSTALIGANTLLNTDSNSFKLTRDILTDREKNNADINAPITKEDLARLSAEQNKKSIRDTLTDSVLSVFPSLGGGVVRNTSAILGGIAGARAPFIISKSLAKSKNPWIRIPAGITGTTLGWFLGDAGGRGLINSVN